MCWTKLTVGVVVQGEAKERFNEIKQELSQTSTQFSNNILDATKAFKKVITDKADVDGLPASALALGAQQVPFLLRLNSLLMQLTFFKGQGDELLAKLVLMFLQ